MGSLTGGDAAGWLMNESGGTWVNMSQWLDEKFE